MYHQRLVINTNPNNFKELVFTRSRSHSKGNGQKRIKINSSNFVNNNNNANNNNPIHMMS